MTIPRSRTALLAALAFAVWMHSSARAAPRTIDASYAGYMNGMAIGAITEHFEAEGGKYRIVSETKPLGLAVLLQRQPLKFLSTGQLTRDGLRPVRFEARRTAADPPHVSADFDWSQAQLQLKHHGKVESLPLSRGTQDRLSIMYQFMFTSPEKLRQLEFWMTNGRKLDRYIYRITPDVEIDTPLGRLKTLHLVKQREPGDTHAEVWLSPQHRYLAVKILIVEKDGIRYEQVIQNVSLRE